MKKCIACGVEKGISEYHHHRQTADKRWHWCKECEKKAVENEKKGIIKYALSFSGGKDSTAMLILAIERKLQIDKIIYFDCEDFEFPEMHAHIQKVKEKLGVEIQVCKTIKPWSQYLQERGWATPHLRWCTNEKICSIRRALRFIRPYNQYIGFAADEIRRVNRAKNKNIKSKRNDINIYPLVDFNITEKEALQICYSNGFDFGGLYDVWDRVSCWCCPLQSQNDIDKLRANKPELYKKLLDMNEIAPAKYKFGAYRKNGVCL